MTVSSGDKSAVTNSQGKYSLGIQISEEPARVALTFKIDSYVKTQKIAYVSPNAEAQVDTNLLPVTYSAQFDPSAG